MEKESNKDIYEPAFVENLFDNMSNSYERINVLFSFGFTHFWRRKMIKKTAILETKKVKIIDLMSGMGETWDAIKKRYPNSELTALDISEGMLKRARKKNSKTYQGKVKILNENILKSSLGSESYDIVYSAFGLKTFSKEQIKKLAIEVNRILKPGGAFAFVEISEPKHPLLHLFYYLYVGKITPQITKLLLGDPIEYKMLWEYTQRYKDSKWVAEIFQEVGLDTNYDQYFFGCGSGIHGKKIK